MLRKEYEAIGIMLGVLLAVAIPVTCSVVERDEKEQDKLVSEQAEQTEAFIRNEYSYIRNDTGGFALARERAYDEIVILQHTNGDTKVDKELRELALKHFVIVDRIKEWFDAGKAEGERMKKIVRPEKPKSGTQTVTKFFSKLEEERQRHIDNLDRLYWQHQHKKEETT